jgi:hypothetical protein
MPSKQQPSTDPSTPSALRARAATDPTPSMVPPSPHVPTEPGLGPDSRGRTSSRPPGRSTPPLGIVVPAASPVKINKNSVELLLEGMQGPQPERPKTTPQTDGQASASYHAEHGVHPARTSPDQEPKVVVERAPLAPTTRIDRVTRQTAIDHADALGRTMETSGPTPHSMAPRVIAAVVAGMTVVVGLCLVLRLAGGPEPRAPVGSSAAGAAAVALAPTAGVAAPVVPSAAWPSPMASAPPSATAKEAAPPTPIATPPVVSAAPRASVTPPGSRAGARPKNPRTVPAATSSGTDFGEFKTTFH